MSDNREYVVALGFFDSVHLGHRYVIDCAKKIAFEKRLSTCIISFKGNLRGAINSNDKSIYSVIERKLLFSKLNIDRTIFLPVSKSFLNKSAKSFLNYINKRLKIRCYVCGNDYKFGKNAEGNVDFLLDYAKNNNQEVFLVDCININNEKVSTTNIKKLLSEGKVKQANKLLDENYFITSKVVKDRGVGTKIGFPTANFVIDGNKYKLKNGVYSGHVVVNNKKYDCVINYGNRPTFELEKVVLEAHLIGFNGNLYNRVLTVCFDDFIRDIYKFSNIEQLKTQIRKDVDFVTNNNR